LRPQYNTTDAPEIDQLLVFFRQTYKEGRSIRGASNETTGLSGEEPEYLLDPLELKGCDIKG
jgi:hypothetical protein